MHLVPTNEEVIGMLRETGALRNGHFEYPNGMHTDEYLQVALAFRYYYPLDRELWQPARYRGTARDAGAQCGDRGKKRTSAQKHAVTSQFALAPESPNTSVAHFTTTPVNDL